MGPNVTQVFCAGSAVALLKTDVPVSGRAFDVPTYTATPCGPFGVFRSASNVSSTSDSPVVSTANSKYSSFAVTSAAPVVMLPFEPHDSVPSAVVVLFVEDTGFTPAPAAALPVPLDGAGVDVLKPAGNVQLASGCAQSGVAGVSFVTTRDALALTPVSVVPTNRLFVVLSYVPAAAEVTSTRITQEPFAATVPFEKLMLVPPAGAVRVGVPQPLVVAFGVAAMTRPAGRLSTKL